MVLRRPPTSPEAGESAGVSCERAGAVARPTRRGARINPAGYGRQIEPGSREMGSAKPRFPANSRVLKPSRTPQTGSTKPPGMKFAEICVYPLGIVRKRSYDGGLSFLAQMQIGAKGGV